MSKDTTELTQFQKLQRRSEWDDNVIFETLRTEAVPTRVMGHYAIVHYITPDGRHMHRVWAWASLSLKLLHEGEGGQDVLSLELMLIGTIREYDERVGRLLRSA